MKRRGRINLIVAIGALGVVVIGLFLFLAQESPATAANRFMVALAKGDVPQLMESSFYDGDRENLRKQWDFATGVAGTYYRFSWRILNTVNSDSRNASVDMFVWRNATSPMTFEERFQLPMVRVDGQWKVDIKSVSRKLYPALPR